jgi:hypothetical protein
VEAAAAALTASKRKGRSRKPGDSPTSSDSPTKDPADPVGDTSAAPIRAAGPDILRGGDSDADGFRSGDRDDDDFLGDRGGGDGGGDDTASARLRVGVHDDSRGEPHGA